ncbi:MAG: EAL domain-containing protein [Duganella sp.]
MASAKPLGMGGSYRDGPAVLMFAIALPLLWWTSESGRTTFAPELFVFFHSAVEMAAVVISMMIFLTGYRAVLSARRSAVVLLGVAFLGVGLLDFLHILSYRGMPDALSFNDPQKSMFFWIAARLLGASALLAYALLPSAGMVGPIQKRLGLTLMLGLVGAIACVGLLQPHRISPLFVDGRGLTTLKIGLEWFVAALNAATVVALLWRRTALADELVRDLVFACALLAISAIFFTELGVIDTDSANAIGHVYKVVAYLYLFNATCGEALRRPVQRLAVQALRESTILSAAPDAVLWVDQQGIILMANAAVVPVTGFSPDDLIGSNISMLMPEHLRGRHENAFQSYFLMPRVRAMGLFDLKLMRRNGTLVPVDISLGHYRDGESEYAIAYIRDLTERMAYEESLRHQATHDELTGLPNRWLFHFQLEQAIARAARSGQSVVVMFLDLDHFKAVNDSLGHPAGDELLAQVGVRIRQVLRETDVLARLGGDEFALCLSDLTDPQEALHVATNILARFHSAFRLAGQDVYSGVSLGVAFYPGDAADCDTLLRYADMAMYQAKRAGRGTYACYSTEMDAQAHQEMLIHTRLQDAMKSDTLELHYQPQVNVKTGATVGVEALLRWHDEVLGQVAPECFIAVAEATGLILPLSAWVLTTACAQIAEWARAGTPMRVSVNFSAQQFRLGDLAAQVQAALARANAQPHLLCVEITESVAMDHPALASTQLSHLRALGCSISLDDFGTGHSSLAYLKQLPITELKIDRSFMVGIPHDTHDIAIARAIITLAHSLGMTLVAEGVETSEQLSFLKEHGCQHYQGWLFAPAMPAAALAAGVAWGHTEAQPASLLSEVRF